MRVHGWSGARAADRYCTKNQTAWFSPTHAPPVGLARRYAWVDQGEAKGVAAEIEKLGRRAVAMKAELTSVEEIRALVQSAAHEFGRIDVLVNAAGRLEEADTVRFEHMSADAAAALLARGLTRGGEAHFDPAPAAPAPCSPAITISR